jgi:hypothetical protein
MRNKGNVLLGIVILLTGLLSISIALSSAVLSSSIKIQKQYKSLRALTISEAGLNKGLWKINAEDTVYGSGTNGTLEKDLTGGEYRVKIYNCPAPETACKYIESTGFVPTEAKSAAKRTVRVKVLGVQNAGTFNFEYGIQAGIYGVNLEGSSDHHHDEHHGNEVTVNGSIYSEGPVEMDHSHTSVSGSVTSYDEDKLPSGSSINGGIISGDAKAYTIHNATVKGTKYSGTYPAVEPMPIPEDQLDPTIDSWEAVAVAGGTHTGNLTISGNNNSLGPKKIDGNLTVSNNSKLKITGTLWVTGNILIDNNSTVYLDSSYGTNSGIIIADHKTDRTNHNYGKITIDNGAKISGIDPSHPKTPSYIMMFSTNPASYNEDHHQHGSHGHEHHNHNDWHDNPAIVLGNGAQGGVFYAPYGTIQLHNESQARALVGLGIDGEQNATIDYDGNMANCSLAGGPAGKWTITEWLILD